MLYITVGKENDANIDIYYKTANHYASGHDVRSAPHVHDAHGEGQRRSARVR